MKTKIPILHKDVTGDNDVSSSNKNHADIEDDSKSAFSVTVVNDTTMSVSSTSSTHGILKKKSVSPHSVCSHVSDCLSIKNNVKGLKRDIPDNENNVKK